MSVKAIAALHRETELREASAGKKRGKGSVRADGGGVCQG
nr:MAG TPA: hypothetical protein [Caudoviricetes sp.]